MFEVSKNEGSVSNSGTAFFEPCDTESDASAPLPFQCTPPTRVFGYDDFR